MLDCLLTGRLIKGPELKTGKSGKAYAHFMLSVSVGDAENIVVSGIAFESVAERLAQLKKGDALSVAGALKPSEWIDKATGETKHGLSVTVNQVLSVYDIQKRRVKTEQAEHSKPNGRADEPFYNDDIPF
jgi:single-stranded DNA-binding protein